MNLKEKIKSWRWRIVRLGHTQRTFCEQYGVSRGVMSDYLSGKRNPSLNRFEEIEGIILNEEIMKGID